MKRKILIITMLSLLVLTTVPMARADIVPLNPTDDMEVAWCSGLPWVQQTNAPFPPESDYLHARSDIAYYDGLVRRSYLKFDVTEITDTICGAVLKLYCCANDGPLDILDVEAHETGDYLNDGVTPWTEGTITWDNQPGPGALITTTPVDGPGFWYSWDIKDYVVAEHAGDGIVSVVMTLVNDFPPWDIMDIMHRDFDSKDGSKINDPPYAPVLEITIMPQCVPEFGANVVMMTSVAAALMFTLKRLKK